VSAAVEEALRRIEHVARVSSSSLDLSALRLEFVPDGLSELTSLTNLDLGYNSLTELPESMERLTALTTLSLDGNGLTELPEWLGNLTALTTLSLAGNRLTDLPEWLGNLTALTTLNLDGNGVTELPESLGNLIALTNLNLTYNGVTGLPESLGRLTALTALNLSFNSLNKLPEWLGNLTALTTLNLAGNRLTELPEWLGNLTALTTLNLDGNRRIELPEWLGNLTALTTLTLSYIGLTELPAWLGNLTTLTTLNLDGNGLTELPEWLGNLTALTTLNLAGNRRIELPEWLGNLTALTTLNLDGNRLTEVPEWLGNLTALTTLNLDANDLTELPERLGSLTTLTTLTLSRNGLTQLPEGIGNLTALTTLNLDGNGLTELPESFGNLTALTTLDLTNNGLTELPESFGNLTALTTLDLTYSGLTELPESFGNLTALTTLNLSYSGLTQLPERLGNLTALTKLNLDGNGLTELPEGLGNLTALTALSLDSNSLTELPEGLGNLTALTTLNLDSNSLTELPEGIGNLTALTTLNLHNNDLTELPESLGNLTTLTALGLNRNKLNELPESLGNLRSLTTLHLDGIGLANPPAWMGEFTALTTLNLGSNGLTTVPTWINNLKALTRLDLDGNGLTELPEWLGNLTTLKMLFLGSNALTELPEWLGNLTALSILFLDGNDLTELPEWLGNLTALNALNLDGNNLTELPEWLGNFRGLRELNVANNPLTWPPPEIRASDTAAIMAFLRDSASGGTVRMWSSKLLIVGEANVGKTSLARQLTGGTYDPHEPQTHGVHIDPLPLSHPKIADTVMSLTLWDFGGQLEYRATQRFYLTDRSLFVLVWNSRTRWRDGKILAWLDVITARAPESPIILVATRGDEPSVAVLPENLDTRYPRVVGTYTVDAISANGIAEVREAIRLESASLPLMGSPWPRSWIDAANAVRGLPGFAVTAKKMWNAMSEAGVTNPESQRALARALHDLGDVVFFADDRELSQRVILRPEWLDAQITAVLDNDAARAAHGILSRSERDRLWEELDDPDLLDRLVRMMERFDLAYRIGDADESDDVALVVELLGDAQPAGVTQSWDQALLIPGVQQIGIVYKLKSRQAGIPTWFIARQHRYSTNKHWSHGALLADRDRDHPAWALLIDDERDQPTITLTVRGTYPVRFLSVLTEAFENIVNKRYPGLIEERLVPCICQGFPAESCGHAFELEYLIAEAMDTDPESNHKVQCPKTRCRVDARSMLDGLRGSGISKDIDTLLKVVASQSTTLARIDARQLDTLNGIRDLLTRRTQVGVHCPSLFAVEDLGRGGLVRHTQTRISLWCEWPYGPAGPHPLAGNEGVYTLTSMPKWLRDYMPFLQALITTLGIAAPLMAPGLIAAGVEIGERVKSGYEFADKFLEEARETVKTGTDTAAAWTSFVGQGPQHRAEVVADFRALRAALRQLDPSETWGGLSPVARPEDRKIVYLCRDHVRELDYPYQGS